ncbi:TetR/AcrR family transcriptional regulator [Phreatobacter sp.]|uniref:TetR/AcrR family transcriptional regulator n=1 Tax=Phreatobacter sp. TaxID=1966341 RepID=UPI0025FB6191|nr:TetR/AcrR family transcriptional regulator [Phreatobacter sp.]
MGVDGGESQGLRQRKRRETERRIVDTALLLFIRNGYDETRLDEIATAAGISRRTFFNYFASKDEILLSLESGMGDQLAGALRAQPDDKEPLSAVRDAIVAELARYPAADMIAIDRLMRSNAAVQARKLASYVIHERTLFAAMREKWPAPDREASLRLVAMMAIGALRLSLEAFGREGGARPVAEILRETFAALERRN